MSPASTKRISFIGKSLLWSVLFYTNAVLIVDWDEIQKAINSTNNITVVAAKAEHAVIPENTKQASVALTIADALWHSLTHFSSK
ncbi:MAG: hypothetical protein JST82_08220 [Bacteroidetes bacterium]|nr:hypothetical protein [Bacteroidota bacterium]